MQQDPANKSGNPFSAERVGIFRELWNFVRANKAYWLAPILLAILLLVFLVIAGSSSAAPFIYTFF